MKQFNYYLIWFFPPLNNIIRNIRDKFYINRKLPWVLKEECLSSRILLWGEPRKCHLPDYLSIKLPSPLRFWGSYMGCCWWKFLHQHNQNVYENEASTKHIVIGAHLRESCAFISNVICNINHYFLVRLILVSADITGNWK